MTLQEFVDEAKRRGKSREETMAKAKQLQAQGYFSDTSAPKGQQPEELTAAEKASGAATNYLSGLSLGFGDEFAAGMYAAGQKVRNWDRDYGELYDTALEKVRGTEKRFSEENPKTAFAAEAVGGILSPANLVAPGSGATTGLGRAGLSAARATVEGGIYGFGEGEGGVSDRLDNAASQATVSGLIGAAIPGAGQLAGKGLVKAKDMVGRNMPLNMAAPDSFIGKLYKNTVGTAYGGRGAIQRQEAEAIRNNPRLRRFLDDTDEIASPSALKQALIGNVEDAGRLGRAQAGDEIVEARAQRAALPKDTDINRQARDATADAEAALQQRLGAVEAQKAAADAAIDLSARVKQAQAAIPSGDSASVIELRDMAKNLATEADVDAFTRRLDDFWTKEAFSRVKDAPIPVDKALIETLRRTLGDDYKVYEDLLEEAMESGRPISGKFLMDIRNAPARASNTATPYRSGELRKIAREMDTQIERLLKKTQNTPALEQFRAQKGAYGDKVDFLDAVKRRSGKADGSSAFGRAELLKAGKGKERLRGERPAQQIGRQARDEAAKAAEEAAAQRQAIRNIQSRLPSERQAIKDQISGQVDKQRSGLDQAISKQQNRQRRLEQSTRAAKNRIERETAGMAPKNASTATQIVSTGLLGSPLGGFSPGSLPTGALVAKMLSSPKVQRALAGQTQAQKALQEALERGDVELAAQILTRINAGIMQE